MDTASASSRLGRLVGHLCFPAATAELGGCSPRGASSSLRTESLRIASVETFDLACPLPIPFGWSQGWVEQRTTVLVRLEVR
jgi:hypothetical protein